MQREPSATSEPVTQTSYPPSASSSQYGSLHHDTSGNPQCFVPEVTRGSLDGVDADQLDERLRRLSFGSASALPPVAGQRITEYENALTPETPRQGLGFKVIKRSDPGFSGAQLADFPNG